MNHTPKHTYINSILEQLGQIDEQVESASLDELLQMRDETRSDLHRGFIEVMIELRKERQQSSS